MEQATTGLKSHSQLVSSLGQESCVLPWSFQSVANSIFPQIVPWLCCPPARPWEGALAQGTEQLKVLPVPTS